MKPYKVLLNGPNKQARCNILLGCNNFVCLRWKYHIFPTLSCIMSLRVANKHIGMLHYSPLHMFLSLARFYYKWVEKYFTNNEHISPGLAKIRFYDLLRSLTSPPVTAFQEACASSANQPVWQLVPSFPFVAWLNSLSLARTLHRVVFAASRHLGLETRSRESSCFQAWKEVVCREWCTNLRQGHTIHSDAWRNVGSRRSPYGRFDNDDHTMEAYSFHDMYIPSSSLFKL